MSSISEYQAIFYVIILFIFAYSNIPVDRKGRFILSTLSFSLIFILSLIIGCRDSHIGTDTANYMSMFTEIDTVINYRCDFENNPIASLASSPIYYTSMYLISKFGGGVITYLTLNSIIVFLGQFHFANVFNKGEKLGNPYLLFCLIALNFTSLNQHFNILRTGVSFGFVFLSTYYYYKGNIKKSIFNILIATMLHVTSIVPFLCFVSVRKLNLKLHIYYLIYFLSILLAFVGIGFHSLASVLLNINFDKIALYMSGNIENYNVGFRPDFIAFNTFFLILFHLLRKNSDLTLYYMKYYMLASSVFFLYLYIPFSDRIGAFSWAFIPIILYDCLKKNRILKTVQSNWLVLLIVISYSIILISRMN